MKRVYAKEQNCVGCHLCEIHCVTAHSRYQNDVLKAFTKENTRPLSRIRVEEAKPLSFAFQCRHCSEAACLKACITGAMEKDAVSGVVTVDPSRCVGCWTCILACPYGSIDRDMRGKKVASKCDLCREARAIPACVEYCPNGALVLEDRG